MRATREQAAASRERIVEAASRLFRERGFDGVGVAELMGEAGLTHGGFYGHFPSKVALMAETCERALAGSVAKWEGVFARAGEGALPILVKSYLSTRHRDDPGTGCALASLAGDASRQSRPVRHAMGEGLRGLVDALARIVPGRSAAARRRMALAAYSSMVGALVLARAVDDPAMSEEILRATSEAIVEAAR
jgi:TetR/AcrR family transcriptional repressor of nem operon